jgi:hypothetical protein
MLVLSSVLVACGGSAGDEGGGSGGGAGGGGSGVGTGSGAGSTFASRFCALAASCNIPVENCQSAYAAVVLSSDCQQTLLGMSCSDLNAVPEPAAFSACFPPCNGTSVCADGITGTTCNAGGTMTICTDNQQITYDCQGVCAAQSRSYSGTCGPSYDGQAAADGCSTCWCE